MIEGEKLFENVKSSKLHQAVRYYNTLRGDASMPVRHKLDPMDIPQLLPLVIFFEVTEEERLKVRIVGQEIYDRFGGSYAGMYLDEIEFGRAREKILNDYMNCYREARVIFSDHKFRRLSGTEYDIERVLLPFGTNAKITHILAVLDFKER